MGDEHQKFGRLGRWHAVLSITEHSVSIQLSLLMIVKAPFTATTTTTATTAAAGDPTTR
jgi:hypothetical protein